ncbi:MAG: hypothetical protein WCX64_01325 [Candidatus Micrarchaeia archaeon]|jgi:hypothetical protein
MFGGIVLKEHWIYPTWQSLPLIPSRSAMNELWKYGLALDDAKQVLEEGYDCSDGKRKKTVFERCLHSRGKVIKIVVACGYNHSLATDCWVVTHVGTVKE